MRIARYSHAGVVGYGVVEGGELLALPGHPFTSSGEPLVTTGEVLDLDAVRLLAPVIPSKIIGIGKNYADHVAEMAAGGGAAPVPPAQPLMFLKPNTSLIGPDDTIVLPPESHEVHHEAELAVVIGRLCRRVPAVRASSVVLGYTCANDVTARDLQRSDGQWTRAKGFDTFCPLGPWIETDLDPGSVMVECELDGATMQSASSATMIHPVWDLIAAVSAVMTLLPGDVILTGTPAGVGPLHPGVEVAVTVSGIGTLVNTVR
jgi:2-keto-4-pentenoate hydratase/2-oxohepta-3-ene-1,7-dioic acid hydratase in catechol pathway